MAKIANWFNNLINKKREKTRWMFSVRSDVWIPPADNPEKEQETAEAVLRKRLSKIEGDASMDTLIDADIVFQIPGSCVKG